MLKVKYRCSKCNETTGLMTFDIDADSVVTACYICDHRELVDEWIEDYLIPVNQDAVIDDLKRKLAATEYERDIYKENWEMAARIGHDVWVELEKIKGEDWMFEKFVQVRDDS